MQIKKKNASVLLITLWAVCLLTVFAVYLGFGVRQKITLAKRLEERQNLRYIAEAGIKMAAMVVEENSKNEVYALKDVWSNNPGLFKNLVIGDGKCDIWYIDKDSPPKEGPPVSSDAEEGERPKGPPVKYGMVDEERKININTADMQTLRRLIGLVLKTNESVSQELAASIIDWRDLDSMLSIPMGSAEDSYYRNTQPYYEAKDAPFEALDELLLVKGMTGELFDKLKDYVTLYGSGKVNINTASPLVLLALGLNPATVELIIAFRNGQDNIPANDDDWVFNSTSGITTALNGKFKLDEADLLQLANISGNYLTTVSTCFMAESSAYYVNRKTAYNIRAVINQKGEFLYWQEFL